MWLLTLFLFANADPPQASAETPPVGAMICIACRATTPEPRTLFSPGDWQALADGEIVRESDVSSDTEALSRAAGVIPQPPAAVWASLTDFESWPRFMPHITSTEITQRNGDRMWVHQEFKVWMVGMQHTTIYELTPTTGRLGWKLDLDREHDIAASEGHWQLVPLDEGRKTLVRYSAKMDSGRSVPGFVEDLLLKRSLSNLITSLRDEVMRQSSESE
ncbi:MAG: hypothetical protein GY725_07860 [bacterium]|nr:hypothetical protein [bacterium]